MYNELLAHGGRDGGGLSAKTVYDVHVVMRSSLRFALDRHLVDHNVAADARPPRSSTRSRPSPEIWSAQQLTSFLAHIAHLRLYPAIHLAATTGMRRGEIAGLRGGDWHVDTHRLSIARSRQSIQGGTVEARHIGDTGPAGVYRVRRLLGTPDVDWWVDGLVDARHDAELQIARHLLLDVFDRHRPATTS
jgi:integrase